MCVYYFVVIVYIKFSFLPLLICLSADLSTDMLEKMKTFSFSTFVYFHTYKSLANLHIILLANNTMMALGTLIVILATP